METGVTVTRRQIPEGVLRVFHDVLLVVHDVLWHFTMFYKCFMMFYYVWQCLVSHATIGIAASATADHLWNRDNAAGIVANSAEIGNNSVEIGDNSAEIGDAAAGIINIAAKVIPCITLSWMETGVTLSRKTTSETEGVHFDTCSFFIFWSVPPSNGGNLVHCKIWITCSN